MHTIMALVVSGTLTAATPQGTAGFAISGMDCEPPGGAPAGLLGITIVLDAGLGGAPDHEGRLRLAFERIPDCVRVANGPAPTFEIEGGRTWNAYYSRDDDRETPGAQPRIRYYLGMLPGTADHPGAVSQAAGFFCTSPTILDAAFGDPRRLLLHEAAHGYHWNGRTHLEDGTEIANETRIEQEFLAIAFQARYDLWANDPVRQALTEALAKAERALDRAQFDAQRPRTGDPAERTAGELARRVRFLDMAYCEAQSKLYERYLELGLPTRFESDMHAMSAEGGTEYFAIAVETFQWDHERFCRFYSEAEQAWIRENLGECLQDSADGTGTGLAGCGAAEAE